MHHRVAQVAATNDWLARSDSGTSIRHTYASVNAILDDQSTNFPSHTLEQPLMHIDMVV